MRNLLFLLLPVAAQALAGSWETCQVLDHVQHTYLEFSETGYRRIILSDNPDLPFYEERGTYTVSGESVTLKFMSQGEFIAQQTEAVPYQLSEDTLIWDSVPFERGREISGIYGTWGIMDPFSGEMAGWIRLDEGTYEMALAGSHESGVFRTAGSGMVHWATEADNPDMLGIPAVWTHVRVEDDQLSYDIACGFTVTAVRLATLVETTSWGKIKSLVQELDMTGDDLQDRAVPAGGLEGP